eukprot:m.8589 g.8589  ORF g.8589 m.8589 type:complete len:659 (-) comp3192_c0_seq1:317-2293(-)
MDEALVRERQGASVDCEEVAALLAGGKDKLAEQRRVREIFEADEVFRSDDYYFCSRTEKYERALEKMVRFVAMVRENNWTLDEAMFARSLILEQVPLNLHWAMFIPCIKGQGTKEQQEKWLPLANTLQIIGTYAQTELGHGTFLRGLETTATFDEESDSFILHSPTLSSTKWWPGALGKTSSHCVVAAKLITKGVDYGTHMFITQLRDLETHEPLPGVTVGDIGPKFGYQTMDNGFLRFDRYKIPHEHMLSRFAKVKRDGTYVKPINPKLGYGTMLFVRSHMILDASKHLKKASTIAIRYASVRRQSLMDEKDNKESAIINYKMVQSSLFFSLSSAYVFHYTGIILRRLYDQLQSTLSENDLSLLGYVHGTTSGLKAFCSEITSQSLEECRKACGGHGYSLFSGLPDLYVEYVPACTYEGENTVMYLQCARYLLKMLNIAKNDGKGIPAELHYLLEKEDTTPINEITLENLRRILRHNARSNMEEAARLLSAAEKKHETKGAAWNSCAHVLITAAKSHCQLVLYQYFLSAIEQLEEDVSASIVKVFSSMALMFGSYVILVANPHATLNDATIRKLTTTRDGMLATIRGDAVALVDAFDFSDQTLNSALGRYDGHAYEALYEYAQKEPLNREQVPASIKKHVLPLMKFTRSLYSGKSKL